MIEMKINYTQTSTFEELQRKWNDLAGHPVSRSTFKLIEQDTYDDEADVLVVRHPDIESDTPLVRGNVRVTIMDRGHTSKQIKDPTWADIAKFFTECKVPEKMDLSKVEFNEIEMGSGDKRVKVKELQLITFH